MKNLMSSVVLTCCAAHAHALGAMADVKVISRTTGSVLQTHYYRGEYWVAGNPGERYAIEIQNRLGERVLAVASVDGVNVVSGETAAWGQTGYVFGAQERYSITGWRKSDAEVAAFSFTAAVSSYADRTGRPKNVGVIGVALFREKRPEPLPEIASPQGDDSRTDLLERRSADSAMSASPPMARQAPGLGTGHGPREFSYVGHAEFERQQSQPNEVIRIRYDSMENLLAMGVVHRQRPLQSNPNPFPDAVPYRYVPDPPG